MEDNTNQNNTDLYDNILKEAMGSNYDTVKAKTKENIDNIIKETTAPNGYTRTLKPGDQVYLDEKVEKVVGAIKINDSDEAKVVYDNGLSGYKYMDSNGNFKKIDVDDADYIDRVHAVKATGKEAQKLYATRNHNISGDKAMVGGQKLTITGYVTMENGEKRNVYTSLDGNWYLDKNGDLQRLKQKGRNPQTGEIEYSADGQVVKRVINPKGTWEPSEIDKKVLSIDGGAGSIGVASGAITPTEPQPTEPQPQSEINSYISLDFTIKRKKFWIKYNDLQYKTNTGEQKTITRDHKDGPWYAPEKREFAWLAYNRTPGHGKAGEAVARIIAKHIAKVRYIMEDVEKVAPNAVRKNGKILGKEKIGYILSLMEGLTPTIYKNFGAKLKALQEEANIRQKDANKRKRNEIEKYQLKPYISSIRAYMDKRESDYAYIIEGEEKDYLAKYYGHLTGKEYTSISTSTSSRQRINKAPKEKNTSIYGNVKNIRVIIDDLNIALKIIGAAKNCISSSVKNINNVPNMPTIGKLKSETVGTPLLDVEKNIKELLAKYKYWLGELLKYSGGNGGDSGGNGGGGKKPTPKPTPKTEVPTERPTEIITQPTTPPTTAPTTPSTSTPSTQPSNNGGNNYNGGDNYSGGNDYSDYGNESSVETPATEAPTTPTFDEDVIKEGNSYKLPTSTKPVAPTTTTSSKGNGVIPVLAGLSAAAAAGIGAKAYMDRKKNRDNDEEEEFKAEDWSENTDVNMEYQEPEGEKVESLDFDDGVEDTPETERYGARTQQDLQDLQ